jgi:hypothetical protein
METDKAQGAAENVPSSRSWCELTPSSNSLVQANHAGCVTWNVEVLPLREDDPPSLLGPDFGPSDLVSLYSYKPEGNGFEIREGE